VLGADFLGGVNALLSLLLLDFLLKFEGLLSLCMDLLVFRIFLRSLSETDEDLRLDFLALFFLLDSPAMPLVELESVELSSLLELVSEDVELTDVEDELLSPFFDLVVVCLRRE